MFSLFRGAQRASGRVVRAVTARPAVAVQSSTRQLVRAQTTQSQQSNGSGAGRGQRSSFKARYQGSRRYLKVAAALAITGAATAIASQAVEAEDADAAHPPHLHWYHNGLFSSFDAAAVRRGYEVYRNVCATCHSLKFVTFRTLVGVSHTEEQAKALAESFSVKDGPNDIGEMFERPGRLSDPFNSPYANEEEARYSNGGALPPDLSLMVKARHGGADYVYGLITGYGFEAPHGYPALRDGLHYNPYFPGGAIAMAAPLSDGQVEYEDGTPATVSQMAKDVTTFLAWAAEPESNERKLIAAKWMIGLAIATVFAGWNKRRVWNPLKTRKMSYRPYPAYKLYEKPKH